MSFDLVALREAIQTCLTPELLTLQQSRMILPGDHPTKGHCAVAAEAAYHILGGKANGWIPVVLPKVVLGFTTHWWVEHRASGLVFDPTSEQFAYPIPYDLGKGCGFQGKPGVPSKRASVLVGRVFATHPEWRPE